MEWKEYKIKDICSGIFEGPHATPKPSETGGYYLGIPALSEDGHINFDVAKRISDEDFPIWTKRVIPQYGDIVFTNEATLNLYARIPEGFHGCLGRRLALVRPIPDIVDTDFLFYFFFSPFWRNVIQKNKVCGATVERILMTKFPDFPVLLPSLNEQKRIASILSNIDAKIENNNKINANLEAQAAALFKSWFVDFEPFKDGEFVESELGMIPKGWKYGCLGDITTQITEKVGKGKSFKVLSPITTGELVLSEDYFTKQVFSADISKYKIVRSGDFAYNPARVNIGSIGMNTYDFDGCVSPVYVVFRLQERFELFFDLLRKRDTFRESVLSLAIGGVRQSLNYNDFAMIECVIPPINIICDFNNFYNSLLKSIILNKEQNQRLSSLRDTLLPKLMSGEIDLENISI